MPERPADILLDTPLKNFDRKGVRRLLETLPKIELHMHLEGSVSPESLIEIAASHNIELPADTVDELRPSVQVHSDDVTLVDFLEKFKVIGKIFKSYEVIEDITYNCLLETAADGVIYTELRFSPFYMARAHALDPVKVAEAVIKGMNRATCATGMTTQGIVIVERQEPLTEATAVAALASQFIDRGIIALDLANDECNYPPDPFASVFQSAKATGLKITVHAGEAAGPENIKTAIEDLSADRIGHGVRILQDDEVLKLVLDRRIPLELCFTSNIQTGAIESADSYPLKRLLELNVPITVNTDDPAISGISLTDDFEKLIQAADLSLRDIETLLANSAKAAFIPADNQNQLLGRIKDGIKQAATMLENI